MIDIFEKKLKTNQIIIQELQKSLENIEYTIDLFSNEIYFEDLCRRKKDEKEKIIKNIKNFSSQIEKMKNK